MINIKTPQSTTVRTSSGTASIQWDPTLGAKLSAKYNKAQEHIDSEVLRRCEPYIPYCTGALIRSGKTGTVVGSGNIKWTVPYARYQYYVDRKSPGQGLRGPRWFDRMMNSQGKAILQGAVKITGGRAN